MKVPDSEPRVRFLFRIGTTRLAVTRFFGRYTRCRHVKRAAGILCLDHWWNELSLIGKNFINKSRGAQISTVRSRGLQLVQWRLVFVGPRCWTCLMSCFRRVEFWGGSYIREKFAHSWTTSFCPMYFSCLSGDSRDSGITHVLSHLTS